jgi:hypothetical protein
MLGLFNKMRTFKSQPQSLLVSSLPAANARFGSSVSLSKDGNTLAIGSPNYNSNKGFFDIFIRSGKTWLPQFGFSSGILDPGDNFGASVALSGDGNKLAVGAPYNTYYGGGIVLLYTRSGSTWSEVATIGPPTVSGSTILGFGSAVSFSSDGNTLAIGASSSTIGSTTFQGTCHMYNLSSGIVNQGTITINPTYSSGDDYFGWSVSVSGNGTRVAVGAPYDNDGATLDSGSCTVFSKTGSTWSIEAYLKYTGTPTQDDLHGYSVSLNYDGSVLAVGTPGWDGVSRALQGSCVIYTRTNTTWTQQTNLVTTIAAAANQNFGKSVALSDNGKYLVVGIPGYSSGAGACTTFINRNNTWIQNSYLTNPSPLAGDNLGISASINGAGTIISLGIYGDDIGANNNQGSTIVFYRR